MTDYDPYFSASSRRSKRSEIRELLKLTRRPGIISFGGGLPAPDLFPIEEIKQAVINILDREGNLALQYGPTEGDPQLREELVKWCHDQGITHVNVDNVLIVTSSQQGLDLLGKVFIDPGDIIMTDRPTYVGAIQAFNSYSATMRGIDMDDEGIDVDKLENEIKISLDKGKKPKFIYVIPDFQNPSGITLSMKRRHKLIDIIHEFDLLLVEDTPYRQLRFEGESVFPLISLEHERVISLFTFSKILIPGFRLGWVVAPAELIQKFVVAKQGTDLCSPPFNQSIVAELIRNGVLSAQIEKIKVAYHQKRDFMLAKLDKYMPKLNGLKWTKPQGGLFLWVTLPEYMDTTELFTEAVENKVAYVIGSAFDPHGLDRRSFRINFSYPTFDQIDEGIKRLAAVIAKRAR